jgi:hypothetical protein
LGVRSNAEKRSTTSLRAASSEIIGCTDNLSGSQSSSLSGILCFRLISFAAAYLIFGAKFPFSCCSPCLSRIAPLSA